MSSQDTSTALVATTTVISTVVFLAIARSLLYPVQPKTIRNPLKLGVYDKLDADKVKNLVYQPDQFPGARDVETPVSKMPACEYY
jgi:hypothetical protein